MGLSRRDIAYCIAISGEPEAEHELYDLPEWAIEEADNLSDETMNYLRVKVSGYLYDEEQFYLVLASVYGSAARGAPNHQ